MDINEVREIMEISSKLETSFRHIKYLCGKYQELEKTGNSYEPYNNYPFIPNQYGPPPGYPFEPYYQPPFNPNFGYPPHQMNPHYLPNNFPANKIQQIREDSKVSKIPIQQTNPQKLNAQQKKPPSSNSPIPQTKKITSNGTTQEQTQNSPSNTIGYPESPYDVFLLKKKTQIKNEYPHLDETQLVEIMMQVWKSFDEKQKKPYELQFRRLKSNYLSKGKDQKSQAKPNYTQMVKNLKNDLMK